MNPLSLPAAALSLATGGSGEWSDEKAASSDERVSGSEEEELEVVVQLEEIIDPATYSAHIATDDKTVLARLRATSTLSSHPTSPLETPSAPHLDTDDVDDDGFERMPDTQGSTSSSPVLSNLIPPPSTPLSPSFNYSSPSPVASSTAKGKEAARDGEVEILDLPIYPNGVDPMVGASAPPPDDDSGEDDAEPERGGVN